MPEFDEWLRHGIEQGWVGPPVCETHDGTPVSQPEIDEFENGDDPCITIMRVYRDREHKSAVEKAHSPSVWRATNEGIVP